MRLTPTLGGQFLPARGGQCHRFFHFYLMLIVLRPPFEVVREELMWALSFIEALNM